MGVEGFNEIGVELFVQEGDFGAGFGEGGPLGDDGFAEVEVDEASGGQLGAALWKGCGEGALVVVVAVRRGDVFPADVDDCVAGRKESGVAGADEGRRVVGGEEAEQVDC